MPYTMYSIYVFLPQSVATVFLWLSHVCVAQIYSLVGSSTHVCIYFLYQFFTYIIQQLPKVYLTRQQIVLSISSHNPTFVYSLLPRFTLHFHDFTIFFKLIQTYRLYRLRNKCDLQVGCTTTWPFIHYFVFSLTSQLLNCET